MKSPLNFVVIWLMTWTAQLRSWARRFRSRQSLLQKKTHFRTFSKKKKHSNSNTVCIPFQDGRLQPVLLAHGSVAVVVAEGEGDAETELNI